MLTLYRSRHLESAARNSKCPKKFLHSGGVGLFYVSNDEPILWTLWKRGECHWGVRCYVGYPTRRQYDTRSSVHVPTASLLLRQSPVSAATSVASRT